MSSITTVSLRDAKKVPWDALLREALEKPGRLSDCYAVFHNYSLGNALLAALQLGDKIGPIATFRKWKELGRSVKKGEKAIGLYVPARINGAAKSAGKAEPEDGEDDGRTKLAGSKGAAEPSRGRMFFLLRFHWFSLAQTESEGDGEGGDIALAQVPEWDAEQALKTLGIQRVSYSDTSGNRQGYTEVETGHVAVSPLARFPTKTLVHEMTHSLLHAGYVSEHTGGRLPRRVEEAEAESVAYLVCATLGIDVESQPSSRAYIQGWMDDPAEREAFAKRHASRVFSCAQRILQAGKVDTRPVQEREAA